MARLGMVKKTVEKYFIFSLIFGNYSPAPNTVNYFALYIFKSQTPYNR